MKKILIAVLLVLAPLSSQALFEIRAGYGTNTLDEDSYNGLDFDNGKGWNLDAIFEPPLITNFGVGLRYEDMKYDFNPGGNDTEMKRLALLVNYRFINTLAYLGVIGTFDISNDITDSVGGLNPDAKWMWSAGVEGGVHLGLISIGAEVGKLFGKIERTAVSDQKLDGLYGKVILGFGF